MTTNEFIPCTDDWCQDERCIAKRNEAPAEAPKTWSNCVTSLAQTALSTTASNAPSVTKR